jgi:hypothetical protein
MSRTKRGLYVEALDVLLRGRMASVAKARDWELLREVARLAQQDAPPDLAVTDPALFGSFRSAVTRYHLAGWGHMTPERVDHVASRDCREVTRRQAHLAVEDSAGRPRGLAG